MKIKKGTHLEINHSRKGKFKAIATKDFDTEKDDIYPVAVAQEGRVDGLVKQWLKGEEIPCKAHLCKIKVV